MPGQYIITPIINVFYVTINFTKIGMRFSSGKYNNCRSEIVAYWQSVVKSSFFFFFFSWKIYIYTEAHCSGGRYFNGLLYVCILVLMILINVKKRREKERFVAHYEDITNFQKADKYDILWAKKYSSSNVYYEIIYIIYWCLIIKIRTSVKQIKCCNLCWQSPIVLSLTRSLNGYMPSSVIKIINFWYLGIF